MDPQDVELTALADQLKTRTEEVLATGKEFVTKFEAGEKVSAELKEQVDKALTEQGALRAQIDDLAQKVARRASEPVLSAHQTPGDIFISNEDVKKFMVDGFKARGRVRVDLNSITQNAALTSVGLGGIVAPDRFAGLIALPERRMTVRDLLTPGRTASNTVQYWQETGFTNNAGATSEGVQKPESTITGELVTATVATIAHIMIASKQVLEDAPQLQSHIDGRLRYGLAYEEELELLLGDGSGTQLLGLIPQATAYAAQFQPEVMQRIDAIRLAMLQAELALFPASGTVLHPTDWARIELTKDLEGRYIFAMPQDATTPRLWGRPVVSTPAMTLGKFLTGAFKLGAQIFDREDAAVEISTEDGDNFKKNLITLRGEERLALACYRPEAFIYGGFQTST
jgi:HK97 family phage major capsid protein